MRNEKLGVIPIATKCYEKAVKFHPEYLSLKFSCNEIIKTIGFILQGNMFSVTIVLFSLLISEYVQKSKLVDT